MATPNYSVNYDDKRFTEVEADKKAALNEVDVTYGNMISNSDKFYQDQIDAANNYAEQQKQIQNEQTDFAIEQIEQQKAQAKQDYTKEQSGAYVDWQKQSNQYGVNAEQAAAQGMANTGYSESSQVSMYNTYQNRVATAREAYSRAVLNYDNAIKDARLQNNAALAEIAYNALQKQLELSLEGFQYKNTLILDKTNKKMELESEYHDRYQDVLAQINTENALAEEVRQYNESLAEDQRQFNAQMALEREQFAWQKAQAAAKSSGGSSGGSSSRKSSSERSVGKSTKTSSIAKKAVSSTQSVAKKASGKKTPTVDMQSVLNLGYGPISEVKLNNLVERGLVEEYESGGKIKFRKSSYTNKQQQLYNTIK